MIADVAFWFDIAERGRQRPSDDEIWAAWGRVLAERRTADSLDVARSLTPDNADLCPPESSASVTDRMSE
jgi:hypothetical protein